MNIRFITVTNFNDSSPIILNVSSIEAIYLDGEYTILKHSSHNHSGCRVKETSDEIIQLITQSKAI